MQETPQEYIKRILGNVEGFDPLKVQAGTAKKLERLIKGVPASRLRKRPAPEKWSVGEILAHLADSEIVVGWRLRQILGAPGTPIQAYDQDSWAAAGHYGKRDPRKSAELFRVVREANLALLKSLAPDQWKHHGMHAERGEETIERIVQMMAGHDINHTKQETDRGGDITYHGPGQLVGYPILNLAEIRRDVAWYMRSLEEAMIRATAEFGIPSMRVAGRTGVWIDVPAESGGEEKLAAIGVHLSRWVTSHGFAYNVSTDLRYFDLIVPCGIADKRATSLEKILVRGVKMEEVSPRIATHLGELLGLDLRPAHRDDLDTMLQTHEDRAALVL